MRLTVVTQNNLETWYVYPQTRVFFSGCGIEYSKCFFEREIPDSIANLTSSTTGAVTKPSLYSVTTVRMEVGGNP